MANFFRCQGSIRARGVQILVSGDRLRAGSGGGRARGRVGRVEKALRGVGRVGRVVEGEGGGEGCGEIGRTEQQWGGAEWTGVK